MYIVPRFARGLLACAIASLIAPASHADFWTNYLKIDCQPELGYFNVEQIGTYNQDALELEGYFKVQHGWDHNHSGEPIELFEGSDTFATCRLSNHIGGEWIFSVVRTVLHAPSGCQGCANWRGKFEIRLNGTTISDGRIGRSDMVPLSSVEVQNHQMRICEYPNVLLRRNGGENMYSVTCEFLGREALQKLAE